MGNSCCQLTYGGHFFVLKDLCLGRLKILVGFSQGIHGLFQLGCIMESDNGALVCGFIAIGKGVSSEDEPASTWFMMEF